MVRLTENEAAARLDYQLIDGKGVGGDVKEGIFLEFFPAGEERGEACSCFCRFRR
jgi:hypothetical protein